MKFVILLMVEICLISNQISTNESTETCGGSKTIVTITQNPYQSSNFFCDGHLIHSHAVIIPAYCIEGIAKENLTIETEFSKPNDNARNVSDIFIHPSYSHCSAKNDLAILVFTKTFDSPYDVICIEDPEVIDADQSCECYSQPISRSHHEDHYKINGITHDDCSSPDNNHTLLSTGRYYTDFVACSYHRNGSAEVIRSLYEYGFSGLNDTMNYGSLIEIEYKFYEVKDWIDLILQYAVPISLNESMTSEEKNNSFESLNIKHE